jgi:hypothetical protein
MRSEAEQYVDRLVVCAFCKQEMQESAMTDVDDLEPNGDHKTLLVCPMCIDAMRPVHENMMQVTREMACDAGDRGMEGSWIKW